MKNRLQILGEEQEKNIDSFNQAFKEAGLCIFREILESERIPEAWKTGLIVKLPKKGDLGDCNNRRGVTLLPITRKVFSMIIHTRLTGTLDAYIWQEQTGFRHGRSCSDHIFTLRQILENRNRTNHTARPAKEMEMDWSCAAACHHQHYHELPPG